MVSHILKSALNTKHTQDNGSFSIRVIFDMDEETKVVDPYLFTINYQKIISYCNAESNIKIFITCYDIIYWEETSFWKGLETVSPTWY